MSSIHNTALIHTSVTPPNSTGKRSRSSVHLRSTEKPSKALKNLSPLKKEEWHSKKIHQIGIPLLASSKLLRERGLGQIDLARLEKMKNGFLIHLFEVKSSEVGEVMLLRGQRARLLASLQFLSQVLGYEGKFSVLCKLD